MNRKWTLVSVLAAAVVASGPSSPAGALSITVTSATNSTTTSLSGPTADRAQANALNVTKPGGSTRDAVSANVTAATRYTSNAAADRPIAISGGTASATNNTDYTIVFQVAPTNPAGQYNVVVNTAILGELTLLDDTSGIQSTLTVSNVTGRLGGVITAGLGIAGIAQTFSVGTALNDAQEQHLRLELDQPRHVPGHAVLHAALYVLDLGLGSPVRFGGR